ncbi:MAG: DUF4062 domain-containing protein, partial [Armatimonadetes bacterium]|nr:DUF4062 domain-containing protein [Armatimonadota bacterium]
MAAAWPRRNQRDDKRTRRWRWWTVAPIRRVFLSATAKDLAAHREAARKAIERLEGFHCDCMENWGAQDDEADHFSLESVKKCDLFVGIVGHCYGSLPKGK